MHKKLWIIFTAVILSGNLAYAAEGITKASAAPAPFFKDPATGMEFVYVKGGCFQMGDIYGDGTDWYGTGESKEIPVHEVCVDDFYIGKYEVTLGQWKKIMDNDPSKPSREKECRSGDDREPVDCLRWNDIQEFIRRLSKESGGSKYRLPTEAEWEYAARSGGKNERYSGGNDVDSVAWYNANSGEVLHPVGTKAPNGLGIYDMSGNVWETTNDWYDGNYYASSPRNNPTGPTSGTHRVIRGGCVTGSHSNQRTSRRGQLEPDSLSSDGFRLMRTP